MAGYPEGKASIGEDIVIASGVERCARRGSSGSAMQRSGERSLVAVRPCRPVCHPLLVVTTPLLKSGMLYWRYTGMISWYTSISVAIPFVYVTGSMNPDHTRLDIARWGRIHDIWVVNQIEGEYNVD